MTVRIGITGPIGCGKSTVGGWLAELGATVIDADEVAREVVGPGEPALARVLAAFGPALRRPDGSLDRAALGRIVFASPDSLLRLERILHPTIRERIIHRFTAAAEAGAPAVAVEAIKLVEGGLAELCDEVWLVTCTPAAQRSRVEARGLTPPDARARIRAQDALISRAMPAATRVIDSSGTLVATRARVEAAYAAAIAATR